MLLFKKKGSAKDVSNYRPISILSSISKIFEKCIKKRLIHFLNRNNFFSSLQFGFQKGKSTEDTLLKFCSDILINLDKKKFTAGLFVDITKAFDMVNHEIMLSKLENVGIRSFMSDWFRSYLENRALRVKINNTRSDFKFLNIGVPQGSVLGPILFLIYINSLFNLPFKSKITAFADDVGCAYGADSPLDLVAEVNWDLNLFRSWFAEHKLVISSKTKIMFFSLSSQIFFEPEIYFYEPECNKFKLLSCNCTSNSSSLTYFDHLICSDKCFLIEKVDVFQYLGLLIDSKMTFSNQTYNLKKYFRSTLRHFFFLQKVCSSDLLIKIYYGIFHSKLQYGIACWGGTHFNKVKPILTLQKYVIRIISKKRRLQHSFPLFMRLKILPIRHLYCFKVLKTFFMRSGNLNFRVLDIHNLRSNLQYLVTVPNFRTTIFRNFYTVLSSRLFNKLPIMLRSLILPNLFKKHLKSWLFDFDFGELEGILFS